MTSPKITNINLADRELQAACKRGSSVTSAELELWACLTYIANYSQLSVPSSATPIKIQ